MAPKYTKVTFDRLVAISTSTLKNLIEELKNGVTGDLGDPFEIKAAAKQLTAEYEEAMKELKAYLSLDPLPEGLSEDYVYETIGQLKTTYLRGSALSTKLTRGFPGFSFASAPGTRFKEVKAVSLIEELPKLSIPVFDGSPKAWADLWAKFSSLVDENSSLSNKQKLLYLITHLKGDAHSRVAVLPIRDESYQVAIELLRTRYHDPRLAAKLYCSKLLQLPEASIRSAAAIRKFVDELQVNLAALKTATKENVYESIFVFFLLSRLYLPLRERFEATTKDAGRLPTVDKISSFVTTLAEQKEHAALDSTATSSGGSGGSKSRAVKFTALVTQSVDKSKRIKRMSCWHCGADNHVLIKCKKWLSLAPRKRYFAIKNKPCCAGCLRTRHGGVCSVKCRECGSLTHHSLLHFSSGEPLNESGSKSVSPVVASNPKGEGASELPTPSAPATLTATTVQPVGVFMATCLPPEPPDRWSGKRDARFFKSHCPQLSLVPEVGVTGSEDCLFLNIYTTNLPEDFCGNETKKAVMVFFHGGDFKCGTPDIFGPDYLLTEDVILITVTSRLGVLGYLNLDNCEVEGNAGLKDQVMALKWVKSEIDHFCGDSSKVMIFGQGSGGTQVQLHILSEKSHGLFQRASSESGTVFNDWSFRRSTLDRAIKLAQILGCQSTAVRRIESCFQNMPADLIVKHQDAVLTPEEILLGVTIPFPPTVEKCRKSKNRFISELPIHIVKEGYFEQVPYMVTINSAEGLIHFKKIDEVRMVQLDEDLQIFVPQALGFRYNSRASINLANALRTFYFQGKSMSEDLLSVIQLYSDIWYANGVLQTANLMAPYSMYPIYFGIFSFDGQLNYYKKVIVNTSIPGACHGDDLGYKFYISSLQDNYKGDEEEKTINYTVRIWANFAKTGNPTPKKDSMIKKQWHPVLPSQLNYFQLADNIRNYRRYRKKGTQFWIKVFKSIQ